MKKMKNASRWLMAGAALGAAGVVMGIAKARSSNMSMKKLKGKAAKMASRAGHQAGDFMYAMGDSIAGKLR